MSNKHGTLNFCTTNCKMKLIKSIVTKIKLTSGSKRGGTGGGVTETPRFATGGGGGGGETFITELLPINDTESISPNGLWPPKPAT